MARWVSHTLNALTNLLNSYYADIACYGKLLVWDNYTEFHKAKSRYYLNKFRDKKFLSFMIFMTAVLKSAAFFSKISQTRQLTVNQMEDTLQLVLSYLDRFISNPDSGTIWKTRERFGIQPSIRRNKRQQSMKMWKRLSAVILRGNATD